jgi:hypothetical protein
MLYESTMGIAETNSRHRQCMCVIRKLHTWLTITREIGGQLRGFTCSNRIREAPELPASIKTQISRDHGDTARTIHDLKASLYREIQAAQAGPNHGTFS